MQYAKQIPLHLCKPISPMCQYLGSTAVILNQPMRNQDFDKKGLEPKAKLLCVGICIQRGVLAVQLKCMKYGGTEKRARRGRRPKNLKLRPQLIF